MDNTKAVSRRNMLKYSVGALGLVASKTAMADFLGPACGLTPPQTEGPFYPVHQQKDKDNDLIQVKGKTKKAKGKVVFIRGIIQDQDCEPVQGALVEIWQASANGKYKHPGDPNPKPIDPNFQYWGRAVTDSRGRYIFRTIIPGEYPASPGWVRPPHVHYKVRKLGYHELTTQMYFKGNPHNEHDKILLSLTPEERKRVVIPIQKKNVGNLKDQRVCEFSLTIEEVV